MPEPDDVEWPWSLNDIVNAHGPMTFVNAYTRQCAKRARVEAAAHCYEIISRSMRADDDDFATTFWRGAWLRDLRRAGARRGEAALAPDPAAIERKRALTRERVRKHRERKRAASAAS